MKALSYGINGIRINGVNMGSMTKADLVIDPYFIKYHNNADDFTITETLVVNEVNSYITLEIEEISKIKALYNYLVDTNSTHPNIILYIAGTNSSIECKAIPIINLSLKYNKQSWLSAQFTILIHDILFKQVKNNDESSLYKPLYETQALINNPNELCCYIECNSTEISDLTIDIRTTYEAIKREVNGLNQIVDVMKLSTDISGIAYIEDISSSIDCSMFKLFLVNSFINISIKNSTFSTVSVENKNRMNQLKYVFNGSEFSL